MTYAAPRRWWGRLLRPFVQCQDLTIRQQLEAGVRYFDIRVTNKWGLPVAAHGAVTFDILLKGQMLVLEKFAMEHPGEKVYVRLTLERGGKHYGSWFRRLCAEWERMFDHIIFVGGHRKDGWTQLYDFGNTEPQMVEHYASYHEGRPHRWKGLFPQWWAKRHYDGTEQTEGRNMMIDFVKQISKI